MRIQPLGFGEAAKATLERTHRRSPTAGALQALQAIDSDYVGHGHRRLTLLIRKPITAVRRCPVSFSESPCSDLHRTYSVYRTDASLSMLQGRMAAGVAPSQ
jgi:hypothetical protein